jgi:ppGpp synthetase/RelA/SpoT-type nucleotidyltranferase
MKSHKSLKKQLEKSVESSSQLEGGSLKRAKKNKSLIAKLKRHGRAFSV